MFGFLNVYKPQGVTSRDAVNLVQRAIRPAKCGHAGTLDPLATGVLVIATGPATRLIQYVQQAAKTYVGTFELGKSSDTEDIEGNVQNVPLSAVSADTFEQTLVAFRGEIQQRPPAYSALKVGGERAYKLARQGEAVELAPRAVTIYDLELVAFEYPRFTLRISCSAGTYIRSLGRDIANALGTQAVMTTLERTAVGEFRADQALRIKPGERLSPEVIASRLVAPAVAVARLPQLSINEDQVRELSFGRFIQAAIPPDAEELAALDNQGRLVAILVPHKGGLRPRHNFSQLIHSPTGEEQ